MTTDPYVDSNGVLKNKLNLKTEKELEQAEADIGFIKLINVDSVNLDFFDETLIKDIHRHIFGDIFDWAGEFRTVQIYKEELVIPGLSLDYTYPTEINNDLKEKVRELNSISWQKLSKEEIANTFARRIARIWKIHPFRDGNTRTILSYAYLYAKEHGFPFDMKVFTENLSRIYSEDGEKVLRHSVRDKFVLASLDEKDYPEVGYLANIFLQAMDAYKKEENTIHR